MHGMKNFSFSLHDKGRSNQIKHRKLYDKKSTIKNIKNKGFHFRGTGSQAPHQKFGVLGPGSCFNILGSRVSPRDP